MHAAVPIRRAHARVGARTQYIAEPNIAGETGAAQIAITASAGLRAGAGNESPAGEIVRTTLAGPPGRDRITVR